MTDPKPDLVKMAREALDSRKSDNEPRFYDLSTSQIAKLRNLARCVIDQLAPPPVKVGQWAVVSRDMKIVTAYTARSDAEKDAQGSNAFGGAWCPYRVIYVTGEEGKGPE